VLGARLVRFLLAAVIGPGISEREKTDSTSTCLQSFQIRVMIKHLDTSICFDAYCCYAKRFEVHLYFMFLEDSAALILFNQIRYHSLSHCDMR